ncbi:MAG: iron-sulfur cluster assembly scaffold protein, partial [Deltaproteobacteria bacterium]|nr:iron-sulfur cluster assembly scaffold protein [Deltaproteobacteria bacterium]
SDIKCMPDGCLNTRVCANALGELVKGKRIETALDLVPEDIAAELDGLPKDHMHCARLAVNSLGEAIDDYYQKSSYWAATRFWDDRQYIIKKGRTLS